MTEEQEKIRCLVGALASMYEQYCSHGHCFMSAGESASSVLARYGYGTFDDAGRIININWDKINS